MCGNKFVFLVFGKCPFLLRWKNVVSVSHPLHLRFSRNKPVTRTVISVNRPFIMRFISGKRAFSPVTFPVFMRSLFGFYAPHTDRESLEW